MIEQVVLDYLSGKCGVSCYMEEPEKPPVSYLLIEKTGSSEEDHIFSATIAVQSYADSLYNAAALNCTVKKVMYSLADLPEICRCKLNSDYNFTDTETKRYRYQAVFDIKYYEE